MPWQSQNSHRTNEGSEGNRESYIYRGDILLHMFHLRVCLRNLQSHKTANKVANIMVEVKRGLGRIFRGRRQRE